MHLSTSQKWQRWNAVTLRSTSHDELVRRAYVADVCACLDPPGSYLTVPGAACWARKSSLPLIIHVHHILYNDRASQQLLSSETLSFSLLFDDLHQHLFYPLVFWLKSHAEDSRGEFAAESL